MTDALPAAVPAATVIVLREAADGGAPEILMVERAAAMAFAGGALVFPGGRIDDGDRAIAASLGGDADDTAARVAAIRETIEEAGIAIGLDPPPAAAAVAAMRDVLHAGGDVAAALAVAETMLAVDRLTPFARWRPAHRTSRIFDTRFYLARLPIDSPAASVDATENVRLFWATAAAVLAECETGRASVIFPTRRNLERLAGFASIDAAEADARAHPVEVVTPWVETRDGVAHLCIPEGLGYPITAEALASAQRG